MYGWGRLGPVKIWIGTAVEKELRQIGTGGDDGDVQRRSAVAHLNVWPSSRVQQQIDQIGLAGCNSKMQRCRPRPVAGGAGDVRIGFPGEQGPDRITVAHGDGDVKGCESPDIAPVGICTLGQEQEDPRRIARAGALVERMIGEIPDQEKNGDQKRQGRGRNIHG